MKIIIEKTTNQIIFAGDDLKLTQEGARGKNFIAPFVTSLDFELINVDIQIPQPFMGRFFTYSNGEINIIHGKEAHYNKIKRPVPTSVTMRQARLALLKNGLLDTVQTAISALEEPYKTEAQIEWDYSSEVHRDKNFVGMLSAQIGLSEDQIDALFIQASKL